MLKVREPSVDEMLDFVFVDVKSVNETIDDVESVEEILNMIGE